MLTGSIITIRLQQKIAQLNACPNSLFFAHAEEPGNEAIGTIQHQPLFWSDKMASCIIPRATIPNDNLFIFCCYRPTLIPFLSLCSPASHSPITTHSSPRMLLCLLAGQYQCLLVKCRHGVGVGVGQGERVVGTTVMEIHLDKGCVLVVVTADHTHKIVDLPISKTTR